VGSNTVLVEHDSNLIFSFHVIGEIFDTVYTEGAVGGGAPARIVQTTLIPAGAGTSSEMQAQPSGRFLLVDSSIVRATENGAVGVLEVAGAGIFMTLVPGTQGTGGRQAIASSHHPLPNGERLPGGDR
jgi:nitrite reductase (NO-forming)